MPSTALAKLCRIAPPNVERFAVAAIGVLGNWYILGAPVTNTTLSRNVPINGFSASQITACNLTQSSHESHRLVPCRNVTQFTLFRSSIRFDERRETTATSATSSTLIHGVEIKRHLRHNDAIRWRGANDMQNGTEAGLPRPLNVPCHVWP